MAHLKNLTTGAVTEALDSESDVYRKLILQTQTSGKPKWEDISATDLPAVKARVLVAKVPALTLLLDESIRLTPGLEKGGTITSAEYTPDAAITGVTTNTRTLTVVDLDTATTLCTLAFTTGVNAEAGVAKAMTVNSEPATGGHSIEVLSAHGGTGIADPGGIVTVEVTYTA